MSYIVAMPEFDKEKAQASITSSEFIRAGNNERHMSGSSPWSREVHPPQGGLRSSFMTLYLQCSAASRLLRKVNTVSFGSCCTSSISSTRTAGDSSVPLSGAS